jgi:hypothetical protein
MFEFKKEDIDKITEILVDKPQLFENVYLWHFQNKKTNQALVLTLYNSVKIDTDMASSVVSVQTQNGFFEIHDCSGYLIFEPDEIIFFKFDANFVSSLIIGKECTCSLYSNISRKILNEDMTTLDAALLPAAMQLSLIETLI